MSLTFGSLFAGIGGFDLGLERAGMVCKWQVEKDEWCQKVLAKHWPDVPRFGDICDVGKHNLKPVDLICGGFPCQPHSLAGKRQGAADDRDLWPEYCRVIAELRPAWVIGENVPGIIGTILDNILSDLDSLNYTAQTLCIPAAALDAPHIRERVFILARTLANTKGGRRGFCNPKNEGAVNREGDAFRNGGAVLAHANGNDQYGRAGDVQMGRVRRQEAVKENGIVRRNEWEPEPAIRRVANGIPDRMDRLRGLGNALVPQAAEFLGWMIMQVEE